MNNRKSEVELLEKEEIELSNMLRSYIPIYLEQVKNYEPIVKIDTLIKKFNHFQPIIKSKFSETTLIQYLQNVYYEIDILIQAIYSYVEKEYIPDRKFKRLLSECLKLKKSQNSIVDELIGLGKEPNFELKFFYEEIDDKLIKEIRIKNPNLKQLEEVKSILEGDGNQEEYEEELHPKHDPNLWDKDCFELFKYLFDNYYDVNKRTKRKLIYIWFFLKEYDPKKYTLVATKNIYKDFIKETYNIEITNDQKHVDRYDKIELPSIELHKNYFEDNLKKLPKI
jgi:hypothetical protein